VVSRDAAGTIAAGAADESREVRIAVARGLGTVGDPGSAATLVTLAGDAEPLVRAAALEAAAGLGCPAPLDARAADAVGEPVWQVRVGAAQALGAAGEQVAVDPLLRALRDEHLDVRKAAVRSLARWTDRPAVSAALRAALGDSDADVRADARQALRTASREPGPATPAR